MSGLKDVAVRFYKEDPDIPVAAESVGRAHKFETGDFFILKRPNGESPQCGLRVRQSLSGVVFAELTNFPSSRATIELRQVPKGFTYVIYPGRKAQESETATPRLEIDRGEKRVELTVTGILTEMRWVKRQ